MWSDTFDPKQRTIWVQVRLAGPLATEDLRFILDTGTQVTVVRPDIIDRLGYSPRMGGQVRHLLSTGGAQAGYDLQVSKLEAMGVLLAPWTVFCHDFDPSLKVDGLIGMDFIENRIVTIDGTAGTVSVGP